MLRKCPSFRPRKQKRKAMTNSKHETFIKSFELIGKMIDLTKNQQRQEFLDVHINTCSNLLNASAISRLLTQSNETSEWS